MLVKQLKLSVYFAVAFLVISGCIDEIRLNIDDAQSKISLDGYISDSLQVHRINLSYSSIFGVGNDNIQEPITGAEVIVKDDQGNEFLFEEQDSGNYENLMAAERGRTYHVEILLADGKRILSNPILLPERSELNGISYDIVETSFINSAGNVSTNTELKVKINSLLNPQGSPFLRWRLGGQFEFRENYPMALSPKWCYVQENIDFNSLKILDTRTIEGNELLEQEILTTDLNYRFTYQYCFHVSQFSMSEDEYTYWNNINQISNAGGSLFDPPPGTVKGNLYNPEDTEEQILGFFSVASVSYKRYFCNQDILNRYIEPPCSTNRFRPQQFGCTDCTTINSSTLEKPPYWIP